MARGEFDGKVVFVTGATSGIGRSVAVAFAAAGAVVTGVGLDVAGAAQTGRLAEAADGAFTFTAMG